MNVISNCDVCVHDGVEANSNANPMSEVNATLLDYSSRHPISERMPHSSNLVWLTTGFASIHDRRGVRID